MREVNYFEIQKSKSIACKKQRFQTILSFSSHRHTDGTARTWGSDPLSNWSASVQHPAESAWSSNPSWWIRSFFLNDPAVWNLLLFPSPAGRWNMPCWHMPKWSYTDSSGMPSLQSPYNRHSRLLHRRSRWVVWEETPPEQKQPHQLPYCADSICGTPRMMIRGAPWFSI